VRIKEEKSNRRSAQIAQMKDGAGKVHSICVICANLWFKKEVGETADETPAPRGGFARRNLCKSAVRNAGGLDFRESGFII
jgi:hypothetical protein